MNVKRIPMKKKARILFLGWVVLFTAPLFMDWTANAQKENLTFSQTIREVEASIPHGRSWGQAILTTLFVVLTYHFHWQNQVDGQEW